MTQKETILKLLRANPNGVTCRDFAKEFLFHKLASRCSELRKLGFNIVRQESHTESPMDARYILKDSRKPLQSEYSLFEEDPMTEWGGCQ